MRYDKNYHTIHIDQPRYAGPVIISIVYEGTATIDKIKKESEEMEKMALEKWGAKSAIGFKDDLENMLMETFRLKTVPY